MAECRRLVCGHCTRAFEAWSDGNPYYLDAAGRKHYAYHPDHERLARCIGNDDPHVCLGCGARTRVDSRKPRTRCRKCKGGPLVAIWELAGHPCPYCREGSFERDPSFDAIS